MFMSNSKLKKSLIYLAATVLLTGLATPLVSLAAPSEPTNLTVSGDSNKPTLTWDAAEGEPNGVNWTEETATAGWSSRFEMGATIHDDKMWLTGGYDGALKRDVWYSENGQNWVQASSSAPWPARLRHATLSFNDRLWVIGGGDGPMAADRVNDVWSSEDGVTWTQATASAAWTPRYAFSAAVFDNKMWIAGGNTASGPANDVWHSVDGVTWTQATAAAGWSPRDYTPDQLVVFDDKLWLAGGFNASYVSQNDVWYTQDGANWTRATASADWPIRTSHTLTAFDDKLWIIGGDTEANGYAEPLRDVWYSEDGASWTMATNSAAWVSLAYHSSLVFKDKLYLLGGQTGTGWIRSDSVWSTPNLSVTDYKICWDSVEGGCANSETLSVSELVALGSGSGTVASRGGFFSRLVSTVSNFFLPKASAQSSSLSYTFGSPLGPGTWYFSIYSINGAGTSSAGALSTSYTVVPGLPNAGTEKRNWYLILVLLTPVVYIAWNKRRALKA